MKRTLGAFQTMVSLWRRESINVYNVYHDRFYLAVSELRIVLYS